jgi:uncharacterized delta-60 repeat protein
MKNFWGHVVSGIPADKECCFRNRARRIGSPDNPKARPFIPKSIQSIFSVLCHYAFPSFRVLRLPVVAIIALVLLSGFLAVTGRAQTDFALAYQITGYWGSVTNDNSLATVDIGAPTIAGYTANAPLWYVWTAPQSGEVELDTIGSSDDLLGNPLDTVLGVYTGNSLATLSQVAANDDLYPFPQENDIQEEIYDLGTNAPPDGIQTPGDFGWEWTNVPPLITPPIIESFVGDEFQYYSGPSGLRFNAVGGQTYYIAVDSKAAQYDYLDFEDILLYPLADNVGPIVLTWAYKSSGVFRFATEIYDQTGNLNPNGNTVPMPLIQTAETETDRRWYGTVDAGEYNSTLHTYYTYNVYGVPVTITRAAGSSGRVTVDYTTEDGDPNLIINGDQPAVGGVDYTPVSGTLVFDDYEMSKTIYVPIIDNGDFGPQHPIPHPNRDFTVILTNATWDPYEDSSGDATSVSPPRVDPNFGQVEVRILDADISPEGASFFNQTVTNIVMGVSTNVTTNIVWSAEPTNAILNFMKANFRVTRDVTNYWGTGTPITVFVTRSGTNNASTSCNWTVDAGFLVKGNLQADEIFPLQPGSDYAVPTPPDAAGIEGANSDFSFSTTSGTLNFGSGSAAYDPQPITFTVFDNGNVTLDKDFILDIYQTDSQGNILQPGMISQCTVTILANRAPASPSTPGGGQLPAGSVDENYNIDWGLEMAPPINTTPQDNPSPGTDGQVNGLVVLTNNETLAVGDFDSYNGINEYGICLIGTNGVLDQSFNSGSGFNVRDGYSANCVALTPNNQQVVVGGSFTSYNGSQADGVARLNLNGSLDNTFQAGSGAQTSGGNGTVYAVAVQPNGQVLVGGNFTSFNGVTANYLARLNTDGSVDQTFNAGSTLNGPVYSLALQQPELFYTNVFYPFTNQQESDITFNVNNNDVGTVTVNYVFPSTNEIWVVYGGTIIYDTGVTVTGNNGPVGSFSVPYGPGSTPIELVVNPGAALQTGTNWQVSAVVSSASSTPEVVVGGNFSVNGQSYQNIALFNTNGVLDTSFSPTTGADQPVYALDWEPDGEILAGGNFENVNAVSQNRLAQFNPDGSLDTTNFYPGVGADSTVFSINYENIFVFNVNTNNGNTNVAVGLTNAVYIGGQFSSYNGTHRLGFARLNLDGSVDTSFLDSTYNQFAGLPKIYSYDAPGVYASGVQSDGNVMIGGNFNEVGGGQANKDTRDQIDQQLGIAQSFNDPWLWVSLGEQNIEPNARDGVRNRNNIARLIGGATPGPGNFELAPSSSSGYQANRNQVTEFVSLVRTNGFLGPEAANFSIAGGTAQNGTDFSYQSAPPVDWPSWEYAGPTRMHADGLAGDSGFLGNSYNQFFSGSFINLSEVNVTILTDINVAGNLTATYQLANPPNEDEMYLGGEDIAVGEALGASSSQVTLIDNSQQAGTFGFESSTFIATNATPIITVVRNNGAYGNVNVTYSTNSPNGGTAIPNTDYQDIKATALTFLINQLTNTFGVSVFNHGVVYTNFIEKMVNLQLRNLQPPGNGAALGISNAVLRLINPNFPGYLTLSATNYIGQEAPPFGSISFTVNRVSGNEGTLSVTYATTNGTALSGKDYIGATNTLTWNNGDTSSRTVTLSLINSGAVGINKQFYVRLSNPLLNTFSDPGLFYFPGAPGSTTNSITNATMVITNNNSYGSVQFNYTNYLVNELGSYAILTVVRSGGVAGPAYVDYATADGTALSNVNYTATSGVLTFAPNQLSASFQVPITNNGLSGPPPSGFYFNVNLSNPTNLTLGTWTNAQVNILDAQSYNQPPGLPNPGFNASINGEVLSLALQSSGDILAGGSFSQADGLPENNLVRLNTDGSLDRSFQLNVNGTVQTIFDQNDDRILVGGQFTSVAGVNLNYIARLMTNGTIDTSFNPGDGANGPVYSMAQAFLNGVPEIYVAGAFGSLNSVSSPGVVRLKSNGTVDTSFAVGSGLDGTAFTVVPYPANSVLAGDVLVGGTFAHYNGTLVNGIARLTSNGSLDATFNPGSAATNGVVNAIAIQPDGRILVGGSFTSFNGAAVNNLIRLNTDGSMDTNFVASVGGSTNSVNAITLQPDNSILVVGQFSQANGVTRNGVTRLMPTGATDPSINFGTGANGAVNAVLVQPANGLITLGGAFTTFNGQTFDHIVQLYGLSMAGSGAFTFSAGIYQVNENGIVAPITVLRAGGTSGANIFVNFSTVTSNSTAVAGVNYIPVSTNILFPPGEVLETVNVPVLDVVDVSTNSWLLNLALSSPTSPAVLGVQPTAVLNILNVNSAVNFSSTFTTVFENVFGGLANVNVTRQGATNTACSVDFYTTTNNSTGIPGTDYYSTNETIAFNPGQTVAAAQVLIISNSTVEKTVGLLLTNPVNTLLYAPSNATLTIIDNISPPGELLFASPNYTVNESSGTAVVTIQRTNGFSGTVSATYYTVPGTALPNINYQSTSNTVTFNPLVDSQTVSIPLLENNPAEGPVNFSVVLASPTGGATLIAPTNTTVTILDDVNTGVSFANATNFFAESNTTVSVTVERLGNTNNSFTVNYFTTNGTAMAGVNYQTSSGTITFGKGQGLAGVPITLFNNNDVTNLYFGMVLSAPSTGVQLASPSNTVIVIQPSAAGISFTTSTNSIFKNSGVIRIPVVCLDPSNEPVIIDSNSIPLSVNYLTANGTAIAGQDYVAESGTLIFSNGIATNMITVPIINNSLITGLRTFSVILSNAIPVPPAELVSPSNDVVTIIDSNSGLSFSSANYSILNGGLATITVLRADNTNTVSTVAYSTQNGGTAVPYSDYIPTNGVLTFSNGQTSASFTVSVIASAVAQPDKTILLALSNPTNGILSAPSASTLTIYNSNGSFIVPAGVALGTSNMPPSGILQSNVPVTLWFAFRDAGGTNVNNLYATLLSINGVNNPQPSTAQSYGPLVVNGPSASRQFTFTPRGTNQQTILASFALSDNNIKNLGTNSFTLTLGTWSTTFSNTNAIIISAAPANFVAQIAAPYPSVITVSNVGGVLVGTTVTLTNLTHTSPEAMGVLVVSPGQQDTLLMSGVGSPNVGANNVTITFSDAATNYLPSSTTTSTPITNGVYKPTQDAAVPNFP